MKTLSLILFASALPGCFMGYDSRWGQAKAAQQRSAELATPATIVPGGGAHPGATRTMTVRVHATAGYQAQTVDWAKQVRDVFDDASEVLGPALGIRLEPSGFDTWDARGTEPDLHAALDGLTARDPGADVDWVCGFIAGMPMVTDSFHDGGMGEMLGKHLVVRARNVESEVQMARSFETLGEDARAKLIRERRRHRAMAILLHELGHTLGAIHDTDRESLMFPQYGTTERGFRDEDVALMRVGLSHRGQEAHAALATDLLTVYETQPDARWAPGDRDAMTAMLRTWSAPTPSVARTAATVVSPPDDPGLSALSPDDRTLYTQAVATQTQGDARAAYAAARPLFVKYPAVAPVQDLRCKIAMQSGGSFDAVRSECDPIMKLTTGR